MIVLTLKQQLLYLVQSSYGLFLVGFLALGQLLVASPPLWTFQLRP